MAQNKYEAHGVHNLPRRELGSIGADERFRLERSIFQEAGRRVEESKLVLPTAHKPAHEFEDKMTEIENQECLGMMESAQFSTPSQCRNNFMLDLLHNFCKKVDQTTYFGAYWSVDELRDDLEPLKGAFRDVGASNGSRFHLSPQSALKQHRGVTMCRIFNGRPQRAHQLGCEELIMRRERRCRRNWKLWWSSRTARLHTGIYYLGNGRECPAVGLRGSSSGGKSTPECHSLRLRHHSIRIGPI